MTVTMTMTNFIVVIFLQTTPVMLFIQYRYLSFLSGSGPVSSAAELCQRMLDFCQRLTTAKRKILEDPELYPADGEEQEMQVG